MGEMVRVDHLAEERRKAQFDVSAMKVAWAGSRRELEISDRMARIVASDPRVNEVTVFCVIKIVSFFVEEEASKLRAAVDEPCYMDLHWGMFIPAIKGQGTDEQQKKWLPLAKKMQIIGCYAQTELGHGSNVQGLETTATFDPKSDEFVIHSPTLSSSKWWPGGLGKVSTHAVVYARLITNGEDHGVHGFIVQLRSLDDHSPLPGITIGDIGTKFGNGAYNTMDNGVLQFDNVRIPRDQMLMRISQVTRDGKYMVSNVPRQLVYGTMVFVRQSIVQDASVALSRAVCIAVRYSAVRRQFGSQKGGLESQVIDYKTQQSRLLPLLASAYAFRFVGEWLKWLYTDVTQRLQANDFSTLPEAHACTAGLKSLTTSVTAVARFLMKTVSSLASGEPPVGTASYFARAQHLMQCNCEVHNADDWLKPSVILEAFEARAARMAIACAKNISKTSGLEEGFSEFSIDLVDVAVAHCQLIVVSKFIEKLKQDIPGNGVKEVLQVLCCIYALSLLHKHNGDFLSSGCINPKQASLANEQLRSLYSQVRPNAVALVDSFNYTDHYLNSSLGRYDGNVYPTLYEEAWKDPLNDTVVPDGYQEYIRPLLKQQLTSRAARL
ncbi:Peroxisomal acyl-coenzyme A oxidase 1 [Acorus gramineus]|uniref:Acyl-coenzyme A oxidase n=1 Tax=Acorus gramineus TaxID=55184 RepID=A0AAV9B774_ACOGR|nr:Peroxisomal acyl-coenzyme A oxidase 1 [Acorus gramineus]